MGALMSLVTTSKLVRGCKNYLNLAGLYDRIILVWVRGRFGLDRASELVRVGSAMTSDGPEPFPVFVYGQALRDWIKDRQTESLRGFEEAIFLKPDPKWVNDLLEIDRSHIGRVVRALDAAG